MSLHLYDTRCEICGGTKELRPTYAGSKTLRMVCRSCGLYEDQIDPKPAPTPGQKILGVRF